MHKLRTLIIDLCEYENHINLVSCYTCNMETNISDALKNAIVNLKNPIVNSNHTIGQTKWEYRPVDTSWTDIETTIADGSSWTGIEGTWNTTDTAVINDVISISDISIS